MLHCSEVLTCIALYNFFTNRRSGAITVEIAPFSIVKANTIPLHRLIIWLVWSPICPWNCYVIAFINKYTFIWNIINSKPKRILYSILIGDISKKIISCLLYWFSKFSSDIITVLLCSSIFLLFKVEVILFTIKCLPI